MSLAARVSLPLCSAELLPHEEAERLNDVKFLVQQLYTTLRIEEHQLSKERELTGRLEDLNSQLRPLEKVRLLDMRVVIMFFRMVRKHSYSHLSSSLLRPGEGGVE